MNDDGVQVAAASPPERSDAIPRQGRLAPSAKFVFFLDSLMSTAFQVGLLAFVDWMWLPRLQFPLAAGVLTTWLGGSLLARTLILPWLRHRAWRYELRENDLLVRYGVLWRVTSSVPLRRIQHTDVESGPIDRMFGLAALTVHTAGSSLEAVRIPGLARATAEALRELLLAASHRPAPPPIAVEHEVAGTPPAEALAEPPP
jgi:membrane protein YdbS with pleckstrin-like domain